MDRALLDEWFVAEVLPLEAALVRYLRHNWRLEEDISDLRQEVYVRVYESAASGLPEQPRPFVFATARNLLIDHARRGKIVSIVNCADLESIDSHADELSPERHASGRSDLRFLQKALDDLPPRCRQVVELRRIDCLSQREVAEFMGISEETVEKHISKGMRLLASALLASGSRGAAASPPVGKRSLRARPW